MGKYNISFTIKMADEQPKLVMQAEPMMCGGHSNEREPSPEEVEIANAHKADAEASLGGACTQWNVVGVQTQVVAGTNFTFNVDTNHGKVSMRVFRPLPHTGNPTS